MHPGSRILFCLLSALALPGLSFFYLAALSLVLLPIALRDRARVWQLLRRSRWLLLALVLGYGYTLPGEALFPVVGAASPSEAGLRSGLVQAWRLALLLVLIEWLVLRQAPATLLAGLYGLIRPLRHLGLDPDRLAVRLGLTLQAVGQYGRMRLAWLQDPDIQDRAAALPASFRLELAAWRPLDWIVLCIACLSLGGVWLNA